MRRTILVCCTTFLFGGLVSLLGSPYLVQANSLIVSTGAINNYNGNVDLQQRIVAAAGFRSWYLMDGSTLFSAWTDGNVWGSDFRDQGSPNDMEPQGGSDRAQVYLYAGHGLCENPPAPGTGDFIFVNGNFGKPDSTRIGTSSVWGNNGGRLQFMFIDASCPMDLPEITSEWFSPFGGLHMATGHSGDVNHDSLDSEARPDTFGSYTIGWPAAQISARPVGDAWMEAGLMDVQSGVCAVATAAGDTREDAINRRENEFVTSGWPNPSNNWLAWKWICLR
jgi:Family of unknown function (DUF6345)